MVRSTSRFAYESDLCCVGVFEKQKQNNEKLTAEVKRIVLQNIHQIPGNEYYTEAQLVGWFTHRKKVERKKNATNALPPAPAPPLFESRAHQARKSPNYISLTSGTNKIQFTRR